jgi:hypothetical protein
MRHLGGALDRARKKENARLSGKDPIRSSRSLYASLLLNEFNKLIG